MEWLLSLFGNDNGLQLILITLGLVVFLILLFWVFRKIAGTPASRASRNRVPRLSVSDAAVVDDKRRLVLVRRDNVEHLLLIGGPTDVVVEMNVVRTQSPAAPAADAPVAQNDADAADSLTPVVAAAATGAAVVGLAANVETAEDTAEENVAEKADELETTVSANLDDMLLDAEADPDDGTADDAIQVDDPGQTDDPVQEDTKAETPSPSVDEAKDDKSSDSDDEMQRLLDELSNEAKQPAE